MIRFLSATLNSSIHYDKTIAVLEFKFVIKWGTFPKCNNKLFLLTLSMWVIIVLMLIMQRCSEPIVNLLITIVI